MPDERIVITIEGDDRLSAPSQRARQALGGLEQSAEGLESRLKGLAVQVGLVGVAYKALDTLQAQVTAGVRLNMELEDLTAQFTAFTKDAGASAAILKELRTEADKTPFSFREMAQAAAMLQPAAKASRMELMELVRLSEILSALNPLQGLTGAAFALREALSGDYVSLVERFNLPRQYMTQLREQGIPAIEAVRMALRLMGADADLVALKAGTLAGKWSTFNDAMDSLRLTLTKPIFEAMKRGLDSVQTALAENKKDVDAWADETAKLIEKNITFWETNLPRIGKVVTNLWALLDRETDDGGDRVANNTQRMMARINQIVDSHMAMMDSIIGLALDLTEGNWKSAWGRIVKDTEDTWNTLLLLVGKGSKALIDISNALLPGFAAVSGPAKEMIDNTLRAGLIHRETAKDVDAYTDAVTKLEQAQQEALKTSLTAARAKEQQATEEDADRRAKARMQDLTEQLKAGQEESERIRKQKLDFTLTALDRELDAEQKAWLERQRILKATKTAVEQLMGFLDARIAAIDLRRLDEQLQRMLKRQAPTSARGAEAYERQVLVIQREILSKQQIIEEARNPIRGRVTGEPAVTLAEPSVTASTLPRPTATPGQTGVGAAGLGLTINGPLVNIANMAVATAEQGAGLAKEIAAEVQTSIARLVQAGGRPTGTANPALPGAAGA